MTSCGDFALGLGEGSHARQARGGEGRQAEVTDTVRVHIASCQGVGSQARLRDNRAELSR